jgi:hypothetical protein
MSGNMRYGKVENVANTDATYGSALLTSFKTEFVKIPGWTVWDDQVAANSTNSLVFKVTTSEGVGNEFYLRFFYAAANYFATRIYESWNNSTHTGTNPIGSGRLEHYSSVGPTTYYYAGDDDHLCLSIYPLGGSYGYRNAPSYFGLVQKLRPDIDSATRAVIMLTWYYIDDFSSSDTVGVSYSDSNKVPMLRDKFGTYKPNCWLFTSHPNARGYNWANLMQYGPWRSKSDATHPPRTFWSPFVLVEQQWGPRGFVRSFLHSGAAYYDGPGNGNTVRVGSRDYIAYDTTYYDTGSVSTVNPWGQYYGHSDGHIAWLLPISDHYIRSYITA